MNINLLLDIIGGLGLFFLGMRTMSDGLKKIAGDKLKSFLHFVTKHSISGIFVGAIITVLIQSSSATTVMVVGFVNAGLLVLKQAITVVMGANIGTTFTAWLVSSMSVFKITHYALPAVGIGFAMSSMGKSKNIKQWGFVLMGFGLLFLGLEFMKDACKPLKDSIAVKDAFIMFSENPFLGVFAGIIFTIILQSSSATIAIVQVLAFNGVISFEAAIPIILGDNIGTTITAQLAAIGTNLNARRAAMSHTMFNVIGVLYMLVLVHFGWFQQFINWIIPGEITTQNIMFYIAVAHSCFNVLNTIIFLPFIGLLEKVSIALVPQKGDSIDFGTQYLETHLLETPSLALEQVHRENAYLLKVAKKATTQAMNCFKNNDVKAADKTSELENVTDNLQSEITQYLVDLSQRTLTEDQSEELPVLIHNVNDMERIGDHAQNIAELSRRKIEEKLPFSESAIQETERIWIEVQLMLTETEEALTNNNAELAKKILLREEKINDMQTHLKKNHIERLNDGSCHLQSGFVFVEIIDNLEKIADRLTNIAESIIGKMRWEVKHHEIPEKK